MTSRGMSRVYPEVFAGGFARKDGTVAFYTRVNSLIRPTDVVLDLGAGRGEWLEDRVDFRRNLRRLQGKVSRVIGADIDPVVMSNPSLDEAVIMRSIDEIPLDDSSVDMVVSDHTLEHVASPEPWSEEVYRVLRPGGWLVGRTPNRWGYIGLATNLVPNSFHTRVLRHAQPTRQEVDVFPTTYRLNSRRRLERYFTADRWENFSYTQTAEPSYFGDSATLIRVVDKVWTRVPESMGATWHVFLRKRP